MAWGWLTSRTCTPLLPLSLNKNPVQLSCSLRLHLWDALSCNFQGFWFKNLTIGLNRIAWLLACHAGAHIRSLTSPSPRKAILASVGVNTVVTKHCRNQNNFTPLLSVYSSQLAAAYTGCILVFQHSMLFSTASDQSLLLDMRYCLHDTSRNLFNWKIDSKIQNMSNRFQAMQLDMRVGTSRIVLGTEGTHGHDFPSTDIALNYLVVL